MMDRVGQRLGNYRLTRLLGQGGFAEVYLGMHLYLNTQAAIKVLYGKMTPQELQNFNTEAQKIAKLKHPHIIRILDFGIDKNFPFMVMDYATHGSLRDKHPFGSILPLSTILSYLKPIAAALQYAHNEKIVHRDVKPDNMLVDENNHILLSDFGLAITAHKTQSLTRQDKSGTIVYMAPEQIQGKARPASDQYALGVVVYEWLGGIFPFDGDSEIEIAMKHIQEPPPSFKKDLKIPPQVEQVVLKALAKDPGQRFASIQEFAVALEQAYQLKQSPLVPSSTSPAKQPLPPIGKVATPASVSPAPGTTLWTHSYVSIPTLAVWSLDGHKITIVFRNGHIQVLDAITKNVLEFYKDLEKTHDNVGWNWHRSPDGTLIPYRCFPRDGIVIFDAKTGRTLKTMRPEIENPFISGTVKWSPDSSRIACAIADATIRVWNVNRGELVATYKGHLPKSKGIFKQKGTDGLLVRDLCWSPDSTKIASIGNRYKEFGIHIWDAQSGETLAPINLGELEAGEARFHHKLSWSPNGMIALQVNKVAWIIDAKNGKIIASRKFGIGFELFWSPDGARLAVRNWNPSTDTYAIYIWNPLSDKISASIQPPAGQHLGELQWAPDGQHIATVNRAHIVQIWNANTGHHNFDYTGHYEGIDVASGWMIAVSWSPDGTRIASSSMDENATHGTVQVWQAV